MLDNIIGHTSTITILKAELKDKTFPTAVLFYGSPFSAKMSTALEVARVLTCENGAGDWSCSCGSCRKQRLLIHPYTLLLGTRYFDLEANASADVLRRVRKSSAQYLFIRAVRKLTRRFDPVIWEGEEAKIRSVQPTLAEIEERLYPLSPDHDLPDAEALEGQLETIIKLSRKLSSVLSMETIPINQIRRVTAWMHMSVGAGAGSGWSHPLGSGEDSGAMRKIVILENADRMYEASSNSLLKILEEPPRNVYLILTTNRKGSLIPTVLSRLRPYFFGDRDSSETGEVLKRIFREEKEDYKSLREYFLYWKDLNPGQLKSLARTFIEGVIDKKNKQIDIQESMKMIFSGTSRKDSLISFIEELLILFHELLKKGIIAPAGMDRWNRTVRRHYSALEHYNQNPPLVLESLYYNLRAGL